MLPSGRIMTLVQLEHGCVVCSSSAPFAMVARLDDDTLVLIVSHCGVRDLIALSRSCRRFRHATSGRTAAISPLAAPPFNLSFERVCTETYIYLDGSMLQAADMRTLSFAMANGALKSATYVDLSKNNIGDEGAEALGSALASGALASVQVCAYLTLT